ncbi:hypothetical protein DRP05_04140 [Archaeoglobales archaeon]|nr:MAG: hypothetical protein DRP05_04140 [Archaeoglobales archaeon]
MTGLVNLEIDPKDKRIAWIRLQNPEKLNVLNHAYMDELESVLVEADRDNEIQAILITGTERVFCAGADLSELMNLSFEEGVKWFSKYYTIIDLLRSTSKPTVAVVRGVCVGGERDGNGL